MSLSISAASPRSAATTLPVAQKYPRFSLLRWPLDSMDRAALHRAADCPFGPKAAATRYPFRCLRYWWATSALVQFSATLRHPPRILDAGCQGGFLQRFAAPNLRARWAGLDYRIDDPRLPAAAYDELAEANLERRLPFEDESFDAIVSLHVFEHLRAPGAALVELTRLLRPGGVLLLGFPTMPGWLARLREKQHRRGIARSQRPAWGHQQVFDPDRCRALAENAGMEVELISGSHFFRKTGAVLENSRGWVRLNQLWGGLFPSLGSELCVILRKPTA